MCVNNPQNDNLYDLPLDGDQMLITRWQIYCINDDIVEMLNNNPVVGVYTNRM